MSYDAIVMVSFGGPESREDVIPFLENVLRGRNVPRERMLADWEANQALVIGTHFSAPTACRITTENGSRCFVCDGSH